jgi:hypothetical protein
MRWSRGRVIAGTIVLVAAIAGAVLLVTRGDGGAERRVTNRTTTSGFLSRPEIPAPDRARYAALYRRMTVQKTRVEVLRKWPEPYQRYSDNLGDRCYEWKAARRLYNLCFKHGVLALKDPP